MEHIYEREGFGENWFTYPEFYSEMIDLLSSGSKMVEVGSWKGKSISYFVVESLNRGKQISCTAIDTWVGSEEHQNMSGVKNDTVYTTFLNNIEPIKNHLVHIRKPSLEAVCEFEDESLDFVFIDAAHDYESVKADIESWIHKVKPKGIIAGHDYLSPGVKKAVDEYFGDAVLFRNSMENCWIVKID